jgi:hypothetical protein
MRGPEGQPIPIIVARDSAPILADPSQPQEHSGLASFLERHFWGGDTTVDGTRYILAVTMHPQTERPARCVGWLAAEDVLIQMSALPSHPGSYLKAVITNDWWSARGDESRGVRVPVRPAPAATSAPPAANPSEQVPVFDFYFVYKRYVDPASSIGYVLLGLTPTVPDTAAPSDSILGWVPESRIIEWPSRLAVEFNKSTLTQRTNRVPPGSRAHGGGGALIYGTRENLEASLYGSAGATGTILPPVAWEDTRVTSWPSEAMRFPVLSQYQASSNSLSGTVYQVAYMGDSVEYVTDAGAQLGSLPVEAPVHDRTLTEPVNLDLLFVIDSTGSMRKYFDSVMSAVTRISRKPAVAYLGEGLPQPLFRYSVLLYRDYVDEDGLPSPPDSYLTRTLVFTADASDVTDFLAAEKRQLCRGCGGDEPEAIYHGLMTALRQANSSTIDSSYKAVILLGDMGNHPNDPRGYTVESVASALAQDEYEFFAIHAFEESILDRVPEARLFREQTDAIIAASGSLVAKRLGRVTSDVPEQVADSIIETAKAVLVRSGECREAFAEATSRISLEGSHESGRGLRISILVPESLTGRGCDLRDRISRSIKVFGTGYVAERDAVSGEAQLTPVVLTERTELARLRDLLLDFTAKPPSGDWVRGGWPLVLRKTLGDYREQSVAAMIEGSLGIPVRDWLLRKTVDEIAAQSSDRLNQLWNRLDRYIILLSALEEEKWIILRQDPGTGGPVVRVMGERDVWWERGHLHYGWVPLEELP